MFEGKLNEDLIELSEKVVSLFPEYINSLDLHDDEGNKLSLDEDGNNGGFINFTGKNFDFFRSKSNRERY